MGLTKEEKAALKAAKKLEKAKAEAEGYKRRRRDDLERELAAHSMLRDELDTRMQKIIITAKAPVFKQNIEVMCHTFDRTCDKRDELIRHLIHLRRIANNQYHRTISSFCVVVDDIIGTFLVNLEAMCKEAETKIATLVQNGEDDKDSIMIYKKNSETHINLLLYHAHNQADTRAWIVRGENFVKKDELASKYLAIREDLRAFFEGNFTAMWEEFKATFKRNIMVSAENLKQVRVLRKKQKTMTDIIVSQDKKIAASEGVIRRLRTDLIAYESGTKQAVFRDRRKRHRNACFRLKQCLCKGVNIDEKQLNGLVMASNDSINYLSNACEKCEKILRLAALCRKFETRNEKVLPFASTIPNELPQVKTPSLRRMNTEDSLVVNAISSSCGLTRLWQRISKAELSKRALLREKILIERENAEMMHELNDQGNRKLRSDAIKCPCVSKTSRRSFDKPHAVDGSLEITKFIKY